MTILEAENQNLRRRTRELETELRSAKGIQARLVEENEQLKDRIKVLTLGIQKGGWLS
jgi:predicted  nucleic acid-binding Zn-ribbon protein